MADKNTYRAFSGDLRTRIEELIVTNPLQQVLLRCDYWGLRGLGALVSTKGLGVQRLEFGHWNKHAEWGKGER